MQVLTWNLFHGRSAPDRMAPARALRPEFAAAVAGWDWDVALLQEVPPWWPRALGAAADASARSALTSRNTLLALRRWVAERRPELIKSNGGGANVILVRRARIVEHRRVTLRRHPERRVCHGVRLESGVWCANLHAQAHSAARAQSDIARAAEATLEWAGGAPAILGGDFNVRRPIVAGFERIAMHGVDGVFATGLRRGADPVLPHRDALSDHAPVVAQLV